MPDSEITMTVPANSRFIATARVTAASIAAELDFSVDEIDELRMGANEIIAMLVELAEDIDTPSVSLRYVLGDDSIELHASVDNGSEHELTIDAIAQQILDAVVDEYDVSGSSARISKRRTRA